MTSSSQTIAGEIHQTSEPCSVCHQKTLPEYYFCPNCGNKLTEAPLSTSFMTQFWIYSLSIILPSLAFLFITKWPAIKYIRSKDEQAKRVGWIALLLIIISTLATFWYAYVITQKIMQSVNSAINTSIGTTGY